MDLVRDVLDKQLMDREGEQIGRADGVLLEIREGSPPRVAALELGFAVLAERIHPRVEGWLEWIRSHWGGRSVREVARQQIPWSQVQEVKPLHIQIDVRAFDTPAFDWERWLRDNVIRRLPGGSP